MSKIISGLTVYEWFNKKLTGVLTKNLVNFMVSLTV